MAPSLSARNADISYGAQQTPVLHDIQIELQPRRLIGVIGPNGSGKSTLVRALSRVLRPLQGSVQYAEHDLYTDLTARQSAQTIGVVPQTASASLGFTVREIVEMGRAPHLPVSPFAAYTSADNDAVAQALREAGIADMADRAAPTLSGGEWQRVLLARALAQRSDVLLLDEPTAHLDIHHQMQTLSLARALAHDHGKAVLAVLHDLNLASEFCDHLVLISEGRIVIQGTPEDVLTDARIRDVYDARVWVRRHPLTRRPLALVLPEPPDTLSKMLSSLAVHVVCGAGTGAGVLSRLKECGCSVTCGVLSADDPDADAAAWLGITCITEPPFTPLSEDTFNQLAVLVRQSQAIVLTDVAIGPANCALLSVILAAQQSGVRVFCLQPKHTNFSARDYTDGRAGRLWQELIDNGALLFPDIDALLLELKALYGNTG